MAFVEKQCVDANSLVIEGAALTRSRKVRHIVLSAIEHRTVLNSARLLERLD